MDCRLPPGRSSISRRAVSRIGSGSGNATSATSPATWAGTWRRSCAGIAPACGAGSRRAATGNVLGLNEDELLWLTVRLAEAAKQIDPGLELSIGIAQPWGEYMALQERTHSPFIFADTLIRSGLQLAALDLELVMGVTPRGSYCRDLLEASRLLDLYALLGVPLRVTLGYPGGGHPRPGCDPALAWSGDAGTRGLRPPSRQTGPPPSPPWL